VDEACALLAADDGARAIAGGQTLVPMMVMRLTRPARLIDINRIAALAYIRDDGASVSIGATTRQAVIEHDALVRANVPLLACAVPYIGHPATRARGTIGGSLAHADPAAELALIAVVLDAVFSYRLDAERAEASANDFFIGLMTTSLPAGGCLLSVCFPVWSDQKVGVGFQEVSARRSDFAFASAAAQVALDADGTCKRITIGVGAITDIPIRLRKAEHRLTGSALETEAVGAVIRDELAGLDTLADLHASAAYRRRAAVTLATRAVADAVRNAQTGKIHAN
jgi:CO/xanthine dehydrogenase FAD-binding subunit